ncbi:cytochrome-c oxidase, cbb3-type subunit III [Alkalicaulis satelles]|uniref:Cbb3-type cytochrome c oxidase subunit n=1 Tax=Alkalicaulis satelles TaxID=2609175 RepID=A0A5M6ZN71_9PROT|nr:cytochrome-c oxidase, cbb3-type subunit III [Alkalicaulis satelles]KAA5805365.1 cytochrome-c oxidase, cbb3-type subunit III [Alkalicaulis satelles]
MAEHDKPPVDEISGVETTGHEWDGITELDNPLPRWWLWCFYASIVWAIGYMIFMPALPAPPGFDGHTRGLRNHSERANVAVALADLEARRGPMFAQLQQTVDEGGVVAVLNDGDLLNFTLAAGRSAFGDNCATCHGVGGGGFTGYPNLRDDDWIWGGSFDDIRHTIVAGIRWEEHPETRFSEMPAFGRDQLLSREEINAVTDYVMTLSSLTVSENADLALGAEIYQRECASCHMDDGRGDQSIGAPNLTNNIWLYGGSREQIRHAIHRGPYGVMPAWEQRLPEPVITALAAYVYLLGGGETLQQREAGLAPQMAAETASAG